jgi:hypothetical protein
MQIEKNRISVTFEMLLLLLLLLLLVSEAVRMLDCWTRFQLELDSSIARKIES